MTRLDSASTVMFGRGTIGIRLRYVYVARTVTVAPRRKLPSPYGLDGSGVIALNAHVVYHQHRSTLTCDPTTPMAAFRTACTTSSPVGSSDVALVPLSGPVESPMVFSPLT